MKDNILLKETQLKILALFTKGFDKEHHVREVSRLLRIGPRTAQLNLESLEKLAILESKTRGKIKSYKLRNNELSREYLKLTEIFKNIKFLEKNDIIREIITKSNPHIEGIGLVFGSYAKGIQKKNSDLDIFVAGKHKKGEIEKVSDIYNVRVSVKNYPLEIFKEEIKTDILIKEILDSHVIFKGAEQFIEAVMKDGKE